MDIMWLHYLAVAVWIEPKLLQMFFSRFFLALFQFLPGFYREPVLHKVEQRPIDVRWKEEDLRSALVYRGKKG